MATVCCRVALRNANECICIWKMTKALAYRNENEKKGDEYIDDGGNTADRGGLKSSARGWIDRATLQHTPNQSPLSLSLLLIRLYSSFYSSSSSFTSARCRLYCSSRLVASLYVSSSSSHCIYVCGYTDIFTFSFYCVSPCIFCPRCNHSKNYYHLTRSIIAHRHLYISLLPMYPPITKAFSPFRVSEIFIFLLFFIFCSSDFIFFLFIFLNHLHFFTNSRVSSHFLYFRFVFAKENSQPPYFCWMN